jgi:hypothetical protein
MRPGQPSFSQPRRHATSDPRGDGGTPCQLRQLRQHRRAESRGHAIRARVSGQRRRFCWVGGSQHRDVTVLHLPPAVSGFDPYSLIPIKPSRIAALTFRAAASLRLAAGPCQWRRVRVACCAVPRQRPVGTSRAVRSRSKRAGLPVGIRVRPPAGAPCTTAPAAAIAVRPGRRPRALATGRGGGAARGRAASGSHATTDPALAALPFQVGWALARYSKPGLA